MGLKDFIKTLHIKTEIENRAIDFQRSPDRNDIIIKCPVHGDKDYAMRICINPLNTKWGAVYCFSCKWKGNILSLLAFIDGVTIQKIKDRYAGLFDFNKDDREKMKKDLNDLIQGKQKEIEPDKIVTYSENNLQKFSKLTKQATEYLISRKITSAIVKRFSLLYYKKDRDKYGNRIVFTYKDCSERIRGFGFRLPREAKDNEVKLLKLKDSNCYHVLYGFDIVLKNNYYKKDFIVLVEGELDSMYLQSYNIPAVSFGTKTITKHQIEQLEDNCTKKIFIMLDGDVSDCEIIDLKKKMKNSLLTQKIIIKKIRERGKDPNDLTAIEIFELLC